jgi:hypothetical protein
MPPTVTRPAIGSTKRMMRSARVLFPEAVVPITPSVVPAAITQVMA